MTLVQGPWCQMGHPGLRHIYTTRVPERKAKIAAVAQPDPMLTCIRVTVAAPRVRGRVAPEP